MNNFNIKFLKKYKKPHGKVKLSGVGLKQNAFIVRNFDTFGIKSLEYGKITANQIESARRAIRKITKKVGIVCIRVYPYLPLMKKPAEVRMGKGKGSKIRCWVYPIQPGKTIFELSGVSQALAKVALHSAVEKLSVKCKIISLLDF